MKKPNLIIKATSVFGYIDRDFKNWGVTEGAKRPLAKNIIGQELPRNMTFGEMFPNPEKMYCTQEQVIDFVKNNSEKLQDNGRYNFFLVKSKNGFFVVDVYRAGSLWCVGVGRLEGDGVSGTRRRIRCFAPQLSESQASVSLGNSDTLSLEKAIEMVKGAGYQISKII